MRIADSNHQLPEPHFLPRLPRVELHVCRGIAKYLVRPVNCPVYLIGAAEDCDLVLGDSQFPDVHSYIFLTEHGVFLRYLEQGPEVTVDGEVVRSQQLHHDARLRMGPFEFRVHIYPHHGPQRDRRSRDSGQENTAEHPLTESLLNDVIAYLSEPDEGELRKTA